MKRLRSATVGAIILIMIISLIGAWAVSPIVAILGSIIVIIISWLYDAIVCCMEEYKSLNKDKK